MGERMGDKGAAATAVGKVVEGTILIRGKEVATRTEYLEQSKLIFYPDNPRVYSVLRGKGNVPSQEEIQRRLLEMEHVKELVQDIKQNGGLIEPLVVRDKTFEVLEGNSRLAAYRFLAKSDPLKWGYVKCSVLPSNIDEALVFALLGQYHIKGKKDWVPYEQAGFLYRRFKNHHTDIKVLAAEIGISTKLVKHLIDTYQFMIDNDEEDIKRWSYYDEYLKSNKIRKAREQYPKFDKLIVEKIRSEEIERAVDLREQLPVICSSPKALQKFATGTLDMQEAYDTAAEAGGDSAHVKAVKKFREWITRPQVENYLVESDGKIRSTIVFELRKIEAKAHHLLKKLDKSQR
jgi:hypothetical protein